MRSYKVTLVGKMPLLMHADNVEWADSMDAWKANPDNKNASKAGDDRSPAFRWLGALYDDGEHVAMPSDNLMRAFMEGGAMVPVPGGRKNLTFKKQSQSGMLVEGSHWPLLVNGKRVPVASLLALRSEPSFPAHQKAVEKYGFRLHVKRAKIGQAKHVRVRPIFESWATTGNILVWDDQITKDILLRIVTQAGLYKGLGDWRPGAPTPGPYGMFSTEVE